MKTFYCVPLTDLVSDKISCFSLGEDEFVVGTHAGDVLRFSFPAAADPAEVADSAKLQKQLRVSDGKKIEKVTLLQRLQLVICLTEDGQLHILPWSLSATGFILLKNVSSYCMHDSVTRSSEALTGTQSRSAAAALSFSSSNSSECEICVGQKKKIIIYAKRGPEFLPLKEIRLNDVPLALCWLEHWICVGTRREYSCFHDQKLGMQEILSTDGQTTGRGSPYIVTLPEGEVMLIGLENLGIFYNLLTQTPTQRNTIQWPADLVDVVLCMPYLVGVTSSGLVDIYSIHGLTLCQSLRLPLPIRAANSDSFSCVLLSSGTSVTCLLPIPLRQQLYKLLLEGRPREALNLLSANFSPDDPRRAQEVGFFHKLAGWVEFSQLQFPAAFRRFSYGTVDVLHIISFWSAYLPRWWKTPLLYQASTSGDSSSFSSSSSFSASFSSSSRRRLEPDFIPPAVDISSFIRGQLEKGEADSANADNQSLEAKFQVLLELANSSMAAFLLKERSSLLLGRSETVNAAALEEVAAAAAAADIHVDDSSSARLGLLLSLVDALLFLLLVEADDAKWKEMLSDVQQPLTCSVEDCRSFLLGLQRPDALATMLARMNRGEEALEIWQQILTGRLEVDSKATTVSDGVPEMLQLLLSVADEAERMSETRRRRSPAEKRHVQEGEEEKNKKKEMKKKKKEEEGEKKEKKKKESEEREGRKITASSRSRHIEELFRRYAPCILRADPRTALPLLLRPSGEAEAQLASASAAAAGGGSSSRRRMRSSRIAPSLALRLLSDTNVGDETLRQQLQEIYIEEVLFNRDAETHETSEELGLLHMRLALTYIDRLLACGPPPSAAAGAAAAASKSEEADRGEGGEGAAAATMAEREGRGRGGESAAAAATAAETGGGNGDRGEGEGEGGRGYEAEKEEEEEDTRKKLIHLLEFRDSPEPEVLLRKVEGTWLLKETALLYGRLGQHEKALELLVNELRDLETARAFCLMANAALQPVVDAMPASEYSRAMANNTTFHLPLRVVAHAFHGSCAGDAAAAATGGGKTSSPSPGPAAPNGGRLGLLERHSIFDRQSPWKQLANDFLCGGAQHATLQSEFRTEGLFSTPDAERRPTLGGLQLSAPSGRSAGILRALLLVLLNGLKNSSANQNFSSRLSPRFYEEGIITLLTKYGRHRDLDPALVLRWLPDEWHLRIISQYLLCSLRSRVHEKLTGAIQEQLCSVAYLHCYDRWAQMRSACYLITAERSCPVCTRRLGSKAFVATPDGNCVHVHCATAIPQFKRQTPLG